MTENKPVAEPSAEQFWAPWNQCTYGKSVEQYAPLFGWRTVAWKFAEAYAAHVTQGLQEQLEQANKARDEAEDKRTRLARIFNDQLPSAEDSEALQHYLQYGRCSGDSPKLEKEHLRERAEDAEKTAGNALDEIRRLVAEIVRLKAAAPPTPVDVWQEEKIISATEAIWELISGSAKYDQWDIAAILRRIRAKPLGRLTCCASHTHTTSCYEASPAPPPTPQVEEHGYGDLERLKAHMRDCKHCCLPETILNR